MTNFFSVIDYSIEDAETGRKLIREFSKIQKEWVAHYPGYISASFLVSIDHKRVLNLVRWKDEASYYNFENSSNTEARMQDRKSTRLNSSHVAISYAVFCLKKKK